MTDRDFKAATSVITAGRRERRVIQREIEEKNAAIERLARKYRTATLDPEVIKHCLYSFADNNAFLVGNRDPCDKMILYLREYFKPDSFDADSCLEIRGGMAGARLTHSHERQYHYVLQSLTLWREILNDMYRLWFLAEKDLLSGARASARVCAYVCGLAGRARLAPHTGPQGRTHTA